MKSSSIRVRFAPSPTGMMHLGNVRAALLNYLFAKQKNGSFILRIEDTDAQRNFDQGAMQIIADLHWLGLRYAEGPIIGGPHMPYFQSQRSHLYKEKVEELTARGLVYRCVCTAGELEVKRQRQIALKKAPRYDRACLKLTEEAITEKLAKNMPYIWRVKVEEHGAIEIQDLAHGAMKFDLQNFSDFPITRQDSSFTFIFANFVDDMLMQITHVVRGEDHLTNTASQVVLYKAFNLQLPIFWHLPIICNIEGKKLSKRDFGFSLNDLKDAGFLHEAICNYLAIIGGSFEQEIMTLAEIAETFKFDHLHSTGHIRYDVEKLRWVNHKWITRLNDAELVKRCLPFLEAAYPQAQNMNEDLLISLIKTIKTDLVTLKDAVTALKFYFEVPTMTMQDVLQFIPSEHTAHAISLVVKDAAVHLENPEQFLTTLKERAKQQNINLKELYAFLRIALTGSPTGPGIKELLGMLGTQEARKRLERL
jgi:glutamyl-tRNA synthetase